MICFSWTETDLRFLLLIVGLHFVLDIGNWQRDTKTKQILPQWHQVSEEFQNLPEPTFAPMIFITARLQVCFGRSPSISTLSCWKLGTGSSFVARSQFDFATIENVDIAVWFGRRVCLLRSYPRLLRYKWSLELLCCLSSSFGIKWGQCYCLGTKRSTL